MCLKDCDQTIARITGTDALLTVKVTSKVNYGRELFYVTSFHMGPIKALTGRETLTESDIKALKALGYTVELEAKSRTL